MSDSEISIKARGKSGWLCILAAIVIACALAWFGVRWQVANMLGELTPPSQANAREVAEAAIDLSGRDPLPRWLLAATMKEEFDAENLGAAVPLFEETVRRSPNDFRWWIELGRAYEQAERADDAERAFKRAVELAPAYTFPQWQIGNFYLREDRVDEAFSFLSKATEKSYVYRQQVFALAWDYFDKDASRVEQLAANTPQVRITLAQFYAARGAADDSLRVWNSIPEDVRAANPQIRDYIMHQLLQKRFFRQGMEMARQGGFDPDAKVETISNPSFEKFPGDGENSFFGWKINRGDSKLEIATDSSVRSDGQRSLKLSFKGFSRPDLYNVVQLVAVQPGARYRLSFMLRTENLRSNGEPLLEVVDAKSDVSIVRTPRFPQGSQDWQRLTVDFTVPETSDGITIRTTRDSCGDVCPLNGTVWYDDFKLERL